jgi:hypothetical protein
MAEEQSIVEEIRANAAMIVRMAAERLGVELHYDEAGVRWLDGFLQRQHEAGDPSTREGLTGPLGSYLGECIIHCYGGAWAKLDGSWAVCFDDQNGVFPFSRVSRQLANGQDDSVLGFFTFIPHVFKEYVTRQVPGNGADR